MSITDCFDHLFHHRKVDMTSMFKVCLCNATSSGYKSGDLQYFSPKFKFTLNLCFIPDLCYNIALCYYKLKQYSAHTHTQWLLSNWTLLWEQCLEAATERRRRLRSYVEQWLSSYVPMCSLHCVHQHLQSGDQHWVLSANDEGERLKACAILASSVATLIKVFLLPGCSLIPLSMISVMYLSEAEYCFSL